MLTTDRLKSLLSYDPLTGIFIWKIKKASHVLSGNVAGSVAPVGYRYICIDRTKYLAHRLAWFYIYGKWPDNILDHINQNPLDNRIDNLREATKAQNSINSSRLWRTNTSGNRGVAWNKRERRWRACIQYKGVDKLIGCFRTKEDAISARLAAERELYGEFSPHHHTHLAKA